MFTAGMTALLLTTGCGGSGDTPTPGLQLDLDREGEQELLAFYLGGYVPGGARDPFSAGLLVESNGRYFIPDSVLASDQGRHVAGLKAASGGDGRVDWEEFAGFIMDSWPEVRRAPASVRQAKAFYGDWSDESTWFSMDVSGSMSPYLRRIAVERSALRSAVDDMRTLEDPVRYPLGTVFVGEHLVENPVTPSVVETTFMVKREDGFWDYFAYGSDGLWTDTVENEPSDLSVPTQCVGCHFGSRQFEPERSFPGHARPGPSGPRLIRVEPDMRSAELVDLIGERVQEHFRRSDTILGLYATLYLSRIGISDPDELDDWERSTRDRLISDIIP